MEYLYYMVAVLVIGLVCLLTIRFNFRVETNQPRNKFFSMRRVSDATEYSEDERGRTSDATSVLSPKDLKPVLDRELLHVRTPWGWPRHEERNWAGESPRTLSERMRAFADRLLRQKTLVTGPSTNPRVSGSIRALLEDRYGRVNRQAMTEMEYQKVKAPRLRDPSEPHDQMDNFGTKEAERIRQKLKLLTAMDGIPAAAEETKESRYVDLKHVKRPWGW